MTTDRILEKLAKLRATQESEAKLGNTNATEAFASMISAMLIKHELSEVDIPLTLEKEEPIVEVLVDCDAYSIKKTRMRVGWQEALAHVVAPAHLCEFLVCVGSNRITFVGTKVNATVAEYAYGVLAASAARMSSEAREEWWREKCGGQHLESGNFRAAWISGFVERIAERFREAREIEIKASGSSTALIRLDKQLVRAKNYVNDKYKKTYAATSMGAGNDEGYEAGREAANRMAIGRKGIDTSTSRMLR